MGQDVLSSSDDVRNARPLRHVELAEFDGPIRLEARRAFAAGDRGLRDLRPAPPGGGNAVLICHALSGDSHVARHDAQDDPGWWDIVVGPGKAIDTDRYFVICPNVLGGCRGTTGPNSLNPATGQPYGADFPVVTVGDIVEVQRRLVDRLGSGGCWRWWAGRWADTWCWTGPRGFPTDSAGAVAVATSARLTSQALAFDVVGRNAILRDPEYQGGQYYTAGAGPAVGLALARMLGHITYLSREAMAAKFGARRLEPHDIRTQFETKFAVGSYLAHQGDRFVDRFDANSYLTLTMAIDLFDLGDTPRATRRAPRPRQCRWLIESFSTDWLFPAFQSREIVDALVALGKPVSYCNVVSPCGHDAFLLPDELGIYGELIRGFLANLDGERGAGDGGRVAGDEERSLESPASCHPSPTAHHRHPPLTTRHPPLTPATHHPPPATHHQSPTVCRPFPDQHLPRPPARLRLDPQPHPAGGQRPGPRLRQRRPVAGSATPATGRSWASNSTSGRSWIASARGSTWSRRTSIKGCPRWPTGNSTTWSSRRRSSR